MATNQIALLAQTPELDPLVPAQRQAQIQALADQQQIRQLQLAQARQTAADDSAVRAAYAANPTDAGARLSALAAISPRAYATEAKSQSDLAKASAETRIKQIQAAKERYAVMGQGAGYVRDNPTVENAMRLIQNWQNDGLLTAEQAAQYADQVQKNPAVIPGLAQEAFQLAIDAEKQLPKIENINIGGQEITQSVSPVTGQVRTLNTRQRTQSPESVASVASQAADRAQRERIANADRAQRDRLATVQQGAPQYDSERGIVVDKRTGRATQVLDAQGNPIGSGGKAMTEFQSKAAGFADRAAEADAVLAGLNYSPAAINSRAAVENVPLIGGALGAATNALLSPENQQAEQAQRNFINAVLRQESGAAIAASEFDNARKQYFPEPGDSPEKIAQKAENRRTTIAGLQRSAGPSYKAPSARKAAGGQVPPRNAKGWALHTDAQGNRAYVSPDGTQFEEVQ